MKFVCNKQELLKGINTVIKATYTKFQKSILECIHIVAGSTLTLDTFDTVTAIRTNIYSDIEEPGQTCIPARILQEIVSKFPDSEVTFESQEPSGIRLSCRSSAVVLQEMDASEFPAFPEMEGDSFTLKQGDFKRMIDKTAFSAYIGEDKPVFTGILFESGEDTLSTVAIDGIRLAKNTIHMEVPSTIRAIVPAKSLKEVARLMGDEEENVQVSFGETACYIRMENTDIYTRLLDGEFMKYESIIHKTYKTRVKVETKLIEKSLEMVSVLAKEDSSNLVRLEIGQNSIELCSNSEYGAAKDVIPVLVEGEVLKIAFNAKYLLDVFKVVEEESVFLEFNDSLKPCVIRPAEGDAYLYIVVPVNVRS